MKTVISGPGFYTSKAGKCEVVAVKDGAAIGWDGAAMPAQVWEAKTGKSLMWPGIGTHDIIGPWIDKPKPIEAWAIFVGNGLQRLFYNKAQADKVMRDYDDGRLVHLIEAEDRT